MRVNIDSVTVVDFAFPLALFVLGTIPVGCPCGTMAIGEAELMFLHFLEDSLLEIMDGTVLTCDLGVEE